MAHMALELTKVSLEITKLLIELGTEAYELYKARKALKTAKEKDSKAAKQFAQALKGLKPIVGHSDRFAGTMNLKALGVYYEGEFDADGNMIGFGLMRTTKAKQKPSEYQGQFLDGVPSGEGKMEYKETGVTYVGHWEFGERHGYGSLTTKGGFLYAGTFEHNHFISGRILTPKGLEFKGDVVKFMPVKGTIDYPSGMKYVGEILNWKWHGTGVLTFPRKNKQTGKFYKATKYTGEFSQCTYHGQGEMEWFSGKKWNGRWNNNEMEEGEWGTVEKQKDCY